MAGEPLGSGEKKNPPEGNALLTTRDIDGRIIRTPLWINQFSTGLSVQTDSAQLREKLSHRPVRFAERYLQFTTIWNVANRDKYIQLGGIIKNHWVYNLNEGGTAGGQCSPMFFKYYGASKQWQGFIENWDTAFAITDVVLSYTFNMRIMMDRTKTEEISKIKGFGPFTPEPEDYKPTAQHVKEFTGWYAQSEWPAQVQKQLAKYKAEGAEAVYFEAGITHQSEMRMGWYKEDAIGRSPTDDESNDGNNNN